MKNYLLLIFVTSIITSCTNKIVPGKTSPFKKLVWQEEFNYTGKPDTTKWSYNLGGHGWGNNELQYYTDELKNAEVKDGKLTIHLIKENVGQNTFTSARLLTKNKFEFTYGRVEGRLKIPFGKGTWPAFWMLGANIDEVDWPASGEIDIMEHVGREHEKIWGTLHYPERHGGNAHGETRVFPGTTSGFHIYAVNWTKEKFEFFVDDVLFFTTPNTPAMPFHHPFFILVNLAMGGNFGGDIDPSITNKEYEIDWIRVWQ